MIETQQSKILIVDDTPANLRVLATMLHDEGYIVRPAIDGHTAIIACLEEPPDLVLLDINMPDMNGYQVIQKFQQIPEMADIPVIFISALDDVQSKIKAFDYGGVDYVSKPFQAREVAARVKLHLTLYLQRTQIERLNHRYQDLFDNAHDLIQSLDSNGNYLYVNRYWCETLGYSMDEALTMNISQVIHPDHLNECLVIFDDLKRTSGFHDHLEIIFLRRDGQHVIVDGNVNCQQDAEYGFYTRGIFRDITDYREAEKRNVDFMIERERTRLVTNFIEQSSHDLRTPLTIIAQQPYFLRRLSDPEKREKRLLIIEDQVSKLDTILKNLSEFVKIEHNTNLNLQSISLQSVTDMIVKSSGTRIQAKHLDVIVEYDETVPMIEADLELAQIAFEKTFDNALLYTPDGGRIAVRTGYIDDMTYYIEVEDNGVGIDANELENIFEPMYKVNAARTSNGSGAGLGLAIAHRIMALHGGEITIASELGQGSRFQLVFRSIPVGINS